MRTALASAPPPASSSPSPSPSPSAEPSNASWVVGDCFVANGTMHATVLVRNNNSKATHSYQATVVWGPADNPFGTKLASFSAVRPGETAQAELTAPAPPQATPTGSVACAITKLVNESGNQPAVGPALLPPPDTQPTSTEPGPPPAPTGVPGPTSSEPFPSPS